MFLLPLAQPLPVFFGKLALQLPDPGPWEAEDKMLVLKEVA